MTLEISKTAVPGGIVPLPGPGKAARRIVWRRWPQPSPAEWKSSRLVHVDSPAVLASSGSGSGSGPVGQKK